MPLSHIRPQGRAVAVAEGRRGVPQWCRCPPQSEPGSRAPPLRAAAALRASPPPRRRHPRTPAPHPQRPRRRQRRCRARPRRRVPQPGFAPKASGSPWRRWCDRTEESNSVRESALLPWPANPTYVSFGCPALIPPAPSREAEGRPCASGAPAERPHHARRRLRVRPLSLNRLESGFEVVVFTWVHLGGRGGTGVRSSHAPGVRSQQGWHARQQTANET